MLLTKLIPPKSEQIKEALNVFNRFLEEPHEDKNERLEILIEGGRGSGKSSIAGGMILKANQERGDSGICIRKTTANCVKWSMDQVEWCAYTIGKSRDEYSISYQNKTIGLINSSSKIYFRGIDDGCRVLGDKIRGIPNRRYVWIEEAEELSSESEYRELIDSLLLRENPIIILTYNPHNNRNHWLNRYASEIIEHNGRDNRWVFRPCYLNMEEEMLGKDFFRKADMLRVINPRAYAHEYLGIPMEG